MPSFLGQWGDTLDHFVHLLVAFVLALPIGWHRAREEQSAGLRTFPLVAIASCALVQTAISVFVADATVNANILQGVVTGIGFIGAGAIIRQGDFTMGHATAATIWTVGIMGAGVGYGFAKTRIEALKRPEVVVPDEVVDSERTITLGD